MEFYRGAYDQFQWDVHVLIQGTLHAGIRYLDAEASKELAKIEEVIKKPIDDEYHQHLVEEHVDILATNSGQERFLRNMALVALASRLIDALRQMTRSAESFSPREKKKYGNSAMSDFERLWFEYTERFGIDFKANANRIAFTGTSQKVRNRIVHDGGEANGFKPFDEIDLNKGDAGYLDTRFSEKYPEYVCGSGLNAEVSVSESQLENAIKASVELVGWLAGELRARQLSVLRGPKL